MTCDTVVFTREETRRGVVQMHLVSRVSSSFWFISAADIYIQPWPLEYIQLGAFDGPPENRRERAEDGRMLESLRHVRRPMFPFTLYHSSSKSQRRYTLYANNEASRKKWQEELINAIGVHKVRSESNMVRMLSR